MKPIYICSIVVLCGILGCEMFESKHHGPTVPSELREKLTDTERLAVIRIWQAFYLDCMMCITETGAKLSQLKTMSPHPTKANAIVIAELAYTRERLLFSLEKKNVEFSSNSGTFTIADKVKQSEFQTACRAQLFTLDANLDEAIAKSLQKATRREISFR
ncbi:MAG: hypothetical protein EOO51_09025 [Flavobacterium sp.]|nr:MAG: hypothetical protein EOO51_09025 [Flavobacterium sp.]